MIKYIVLNILFSTTFAPTVPIASDYDYEGSIIIQPISNTELWWAQTRACTEVLMDRET